MHTTQPVTASALFAGLCLLFTSCTPSSDSATSSDDAAGKVKVFVSVLPQQAVVQRIGGEHVAVDTMVTTGGDPHGFSATAKQMVALGRADMYLTVGMPFEVQYLPKIQETRPDLLVESMVEGIDLMEMDPNHHHGDDADEGEDAHGHAHGHESGELDPHVWLSPALLKVMAWNAGDALSEAAPEHAEFFEANVTAFEAELDEVDARIRTLLESHKGKKFYVFHPAFGYFAEAYELEQKAIESDGQNPSPTELAEIIAEMKQAGAKVIFTQPQFDDSPAKAIASQIGASVASIDPLDADVIANLERIATELDTGLRK
ncbi:MAG: zinc transport system substrate-binding protein [Verrucomicrobiales bacterium]|jgi:zinc transport system substrate-binding protein